MTPEQHREQEEYNRKADKHDHTLVVILGTLAVVGIIYSILTAVHP